MRMTQEEFMALCLKKNIKATVQAGKKSCLDGLTQQLPTDRKNKYNNKKIYLYESGIASEEKTDKFGPLVSVFDSKKEYDRWEQLRLFEKAGKISDLKKQIPILIQEPCERNNEKINKIEYKADFMYFDNANQRTVVEDVKGFDSATQKYITTKDFALKWKLLKYRYPEYIFKIF